MALAYRLPAYQGAMAAVAARHAREGDRRRPVKYERNSPQANSARAAESAPAATGAALAGLNAQLGGGWFSHRVVKAVTPDG